MSRKDVITVEDINRLTDNGRMVFEREIGKFSTTSNISSPLRTGDSNPSFRIFQNNSSIWSFKDFGANQSTGSYITFIKELYNLSFKEAINYIWKNFNGEQNKLTRRTIETKEIKKEPLLFEFNDCRFTDDHKRYMEGKYGLDEEFLNNNDVWAVDKWAINKKVQNKTKDEYNFAYVPKDMNGNELKGKLKILSLGPNVDEKKKWRTNVPNSFLWNTHRIKKDCKQLFIMKSVKDMNVFIKHFNLCCIALQNESAKILLENNYDYLESIEKEKIMVLGSDFQGWHESYLITYLTEWSYFNIPNHLYDNYEIEDPADYVANFSVKSLQNLLKLKGYL